MNAERHQRVQDLFEAGCDLSREERSTFLARECGRDEDLRSLVESLLDLDSEAGSELETPALDRRRPTFLDAAAPEPRLPDRVGRYRVISRLGAGGMGVVYEAEQDQPRRRVALKVLRADLVSPEMLRRFEIEAQVLGRLSHPGIARILEAGTADLGRGPQPFFAMELIEGEPLVDHAKRRSLSVRACLELVTRVCDAVQHAHQKGVIHRDLKPSNILVDGDGQPRILDFGVARVTDSDLSSGTVLTRTGELMGTLPYMSPEQVSGDPAALDTRCDVYALGVLAYEILAEKRPFDVSRKSLAEAARIICEEEPTRLGLLRRGLAGDVETIVAKAMEKDQRRRYGSAEELASDVRRALADEPISARPASRSYQLLKFARRNRTLVGGVAAVLLVLLVGLIASTLLFFEKEEQRVAAENRGQELANALGTANENLARALQAEDLARGEEARARFEAETAQAVTDYLVTLFEHANPEQSAGAKVTALEMLDQGVERIRGEFLDRPAIRARLLNVFGKIYNWLQLYERSRPILEEALARTAELHGEDSAEYADTLERLAQVHLEAEDLATSESMHRRVLDLRERHLGKGHPLYTDALNNLANSLFSKGDYEEGERLLLLARELRVERLGEEHEDVAQIDVNLGLLYDYLGRHEDAERCLSRSVAVMRARHGDHHWRSLSARVALADCLRLLQRDAAALEHAEAAYEGLRSLFGEESLMTSRALKIYAGCLRDSGEPAEAAQVLRKLVARHEKLRGVDAEYGYLLHILASTVQGFGDSGEAEALYLQVLGLRAELEAGNPQLTIETRHNLSVLYQKTGRLDEALALELEVLSERERIFGLVHPDTRGSLNNLAEVYRKMGRTEEEGAIRRMKLAAVERELGADSEPALVACLQLSRFLVRSGVFGEAEALLLAAWERRRPDQGSPGDDATRIPEALIALYTASERPAGIAEWTACREAVRGDAGER